MAPLAGESWFVYMLRCADGSLYTGITTDLKEHTRPLPACEIVPL